MPPRKPKEPKLAGDAPAEPKAKPAELPASIPATGKFEVHVLGEKARVYNKQGQAVSGELTIAEANDLAFQHGSRDPERK
jgi:hypothetical protein